MNVGQPEPEKLTTKATLLAEEFAKIGGDWHPTRMVRALRASFSAAALRTGTEEPVDVEESQKEIQAIGELILALGGRAIALVKSGALLPTSLRRWAQARYRRGLTTRASPAAVQSLGAPPLRPLQTRPTPLPRGRVRAVMQKRRSAFTSVTTVTVPRETVALTLTTRSCASVHWPPVGMRATSRRRAYGVNVGQPELEKLTTKATLLAEEFAKIGGDWHPTRMVRALRARFSAAALRTVEESQKEIQAIGELILALGGRAIALVKSGALLPTSLRRWAQARYRRGLTTRASPAAVQSLGAPPPKKAKAVPVPAPRLAPRRRGAGDSPLRARLDAMEMELEALKRGSDGGASQVGGWLKHRP